MDNANTQEYLEKIQLQVIDNLKRTTTHAPSVQMTDVPRDSMGINDQDDAALDDLDEDTHPDQRKTKRQWDNYVEREDELSASEDEEENERNGVRRQPGIKRRRNIMDYQNADPAPEDEDIVSGAVSPGGRNGTKNGEDDRHSADDNAQLSESFDDLDELDEPSGSELGNRSDIEADDGDVDMEDNFHSSGTGAALPQPRISSPQRQEATPPDSPPPVAAQPTAPTQQAADEIGNGDMDEGDTVEDLAPATAKDEGREEREAEDVRGEKAAEVVERQEEG